LRCSGRLFQLNQQCVFLQNCTVLFLLFPRSYRDVHINNPAHSRHEHRCSLANHSLAMVNDLQCVTNAHLSYPCRPHATPVSARDLDHEGQTRTRTGAALTTELSSVVDRHVEMQHLVHVHLGCNSISQSCISDGT